MLELWKTVWRWKKYQPGNSKNCGLVIYSIGAVGDWVLIAKIDKYENVKDAQRVITFDMTFSKIVIRRLGLRQIITLVRHKKARFDSKSMVRHTLRESVPRLLNEGSTAMTACCAPACSQALPVEPQGVWARGIEAWAKSRDRRNWSCGGGGLRGPPV